MFCHMQVAIEIQEAAQFAANCHLQLGRSVAKRLLLEGAGYTVVEIAYFEWVASKTSEQQQRLLTELLSASQMVGFSTPAPGPGPRFSSLPVPVYSSAPVLGSLHSQAVPPFSRNSSATSSVFSGNYQPAKQPSSTSAFNLESLSRSLQ